MATWWTGTTLTDRFYDFADVGRLKVLALKDKILRINPNARVDTVEGYLGEHNTETIVAKADIVFDTIDFLDLPAILRLHISSKRRHVPVFTALSVGFGALVWYFPADTSLSLADIIAPDASRATETCNAKPSYAEVFASFIQRLAPHLDQQVVEQVRQVLALMKDGKPCPASQVAVGSFAIGAMSMTMIHDLLAGNPVPAAPKLVVHSFKSLRTTIVDLSSAHG
jgi:molybdopterin-synthase adenylyltransferase